jgi:hypothetical protein
MNNARPEADYVGVAADYATPPKRLFSLVLSTTSSGDPAGGRSEVSNMFLVNLCSLQGFRPLAVPSDVRRYPTIANHRRYCFKRLLSERIYLSTRSKGHRISSVLLIRRIDYLTPTNLGRKGGVPPLDSVPRSGRRERLRGRI